jgi:hypothetical protein
MSDIEVPLLTEALDGLADGVCYNGDDVVVVLAGSRLFHPDPHNRHLSTYHRMCGVEPFCASVCTDTERGSRCSSR